MGNKRKILNGYNQSKNLDDYRVSRSDKQRGYQEIEEVKPFKGRKRNKKYPCNKLKGEHDFILNKKSIFNVIGGEIEEYRCSACGKKEIIFKIIN